MIPFIKIIWSLNRLICIGIHIPRIVKMASFTELPSSCFAYLKSDTQGIWLGKIHHDDVIKWKHFSRYWTFVRGIHRSQRPHKGQWRGALMFSLICAWINGWGNNGEAGDLRRYHTHYDVIVMLSFVYFIGHFCHWDILHRWFFGSVIF